MVNLTNLTTEKLKEYTLRQSNTNDVLLILREKTRIRTGKMKTIKNIGALKETKVNFHHLTSGKGGDATNNKVTISLFANTNGVDGFIRLDNGTLSR